MKKVLEDDPKIIRREKFFTSIKMSLFFIASVVFCLTIVILARATEAERGFIEEFNLVRESCGFFGKHLLLTLLLVFFLASRVIYSELEYVDADDERYF